jgi:hypothetical protein
MVATGQLPAPMLPNTFHPRENLAANTVAVVYHCRAKYFVPNPGPAGPQLFKEGL